MAGFTKIVDLITEEQARSYNDTLRRSPSRESHRHEPRSEAAPEDVIFKIKYPRGRGDKGYDEINVPRFRPTPELILRKGIVFYGNTASGKTTLFHYFIKAIQDEISNAVAFAPTNDQNDAYTDVLPGPLIHETIPESVLIDIYERQKSAAAISKRVNDPDAINQLFQMVATPADLGEIEDIEHKFSRIVRHCDNPGESKRIQERANKRILNMKKAVISREKKRLRPELIKNSQLRAVLSYIDFKSDALIFFDDAMDELDLLFKRTKKKASTDVVSAFFTKGRHAHITHFYSYQDDKKIVPGLRRNANISVFTDRQSANLFFGRESNGIPELESRQATAIINFIFDEKKSGSKFNKLIYLREGEHKFMWVRAEDVNTKPVLCGPEVWSYCEKIAARESGKKSEFDIRFEELF